MKSLKKLLAFILAIALFICSIPFSVSAESIIDSLFEEPSLVSAESIIDSSFQESSLETVEQTDVESEILYEINEKRDETTKYFAMSDGTIKACIYPQPVHYKKGQEYLEIDNTLIQTKSNGKIYYENSANSFKAKLPESCEEYIEFSDENGFVKFRLVGALNKPIEKLNKVKPKNSKSDKTIVQNNSDRAIYKSVKADIDIEYDVSGNKLKETIVLNKKSKQSFAFEIVTSAKSAVKNNDNSISFYDDKGTEIYVMASPYMLDAAGEHSSEIETTLTKTTTGYTLVYTPNYEWLSQKNREYPVRIDPTMFKAIVKEPVEDTYVGNMQFATDTNIKGDWEIINIGRRIKTVASKQTILRGLLRFDIPAEIGKTDTIVSAKLYLTHHKSTIYDDIMYISNNGINITVHELTSGFDEMETWWDNMPSYNPTVVDYATVNTQNYTEDLSNSFDTYDLTSLVSKWHRGDTTNYGIMLKYEDEDVEVTSDQQVYYFAKQSTYYGSLSKHVEITYRNTVGLEDYWNYQSQNLGLSGTGYVNLYNGNLVYTHNDTSFNSGINGFTLSHIYNSNSATTDSSGLNQYYGNGWRLNFVQKLEPVTIEGNNSVKYKYTDGDGTQHYFVQTTDGKIVDEDGLGLTYSDISEGELIRKITNKNNTELKFDNNNFLRQIIDSNGNSINIRYFPILNSYCPVGITTSSGGVYSLNYGEGGKLINIVDNAYRITEFTYSNNNLQTIKYPDGTITTFEYIGNKLTKVHAPDNSRLNYDYYANDRVKNVSIVGKNGTYGNTVSFSYSHNQTEVTDLNNKKLTYQFDNFGRVTCVYDNHQNIYNQTYTPTVTNSSGIFSNNKVATSSNGDMYVDNLLYNPIFSNGFSYWLQYSEGSSGTRSIVTDHSLLSTNSILVTSGSTADSSAILQSVGLGHGKTYTLSAYVKYENVQSEGFGGGLQLVTSSNRFIQVFKTGSTNTTNNNGFERISVTVALEPNEYINRISVGLFYAKGSMYIDSIQLEEGDTANNINLISNSSFEKNSGVGSQPIDFSSSTGNTVGGINTNNLLAGGDTCNMMIAGKNTARQGVYQTINVSGKAGDVFSFGGWGKADSIPLHSQTNFGLYLHMIYTDGTSNWFNADFNIHVNNWQFVQYTFPAEKDYSYVEVCLEYNYNCNNAYFDNLFLYRDTMQSYVYDANGNIVSTQDYASQNSNLEYDNSNISKLLNSQGTGFEYFYDNNGNIKSSHSSEGLVNYFTYDEKGNVVSSTTFANESSASLQSGKTYYIQICSSGEYLTVENGGTNVIEVPFTGGNEQKWKLMSSPKGGFILIPQSSPTSALDVYACQDIQDTSVIIWTQNGGDNQRFYIIPQKNYSYQIKSSFSADGKIVTLNRPVTSDNVTILSAQGEMNPDQCWNFKEVQASTSYGGSLNLENGVYSFRARHNGKYIYATEACIAGTNIQQYEYNDSATQKFRIERYGTTEYYTISPVSNSNVCITFTDDTLGANQWYIRLENKTYSSGQLFRFIYNSSSDAYYIVPQKNESMCLDVKDLSTANNGIIIGYSQCNSPNQCFIIERVSDLITSSMTYQDNGNYPHTVTDSRGNTTTYIYDTARGINTAVEDAKGNTTSYTYNQLNDRLEAVSADDKTVSYVYETNGDIKNITSSGGTVYNFAYDEFGRNTQISVGNNVLSNTVYRDNYSSLISRFTYGHGVYKDYIYDDLDRVKTESINGVPSRVYTYDKRGNIAKINDNLRGITTGFAYDLIGRITDINISDGQRLNFIYDKYNRVSNSVWSVADISLDTKYIYGDSSVSGQKTGLIYGVSLNNTQKIEYTYDILSRLDRKILNTATPFATEYSYLEGATQGTTTTLVKSVKNGYDTLEYSYDELGNITQVKKNGSVIESYSYDALNQLVSATYGGNTYTYTYDNGGNITQVKKNGSVIKSYGYTDGNWKDKLTSFNGQTITYDEIGNPLTYRNNMSFTWVNGRQLASVTGGIGSVNYLYNADGLRTTKTVNGITTEYYWADGILYGQRTGSEYMLFLYDESGNKYGFILKNGTTEEYYYYTFNLQGDVIGIVDNFGNIVVEYTYGAWGDLLSVTGTRANTIGQTNPIRYRGYYYDSETGFYLTGTRYYDPEIGRFINADDTAVLDADYENIAQYNLYAYCWNNPVNMNDQDGYWPKWKTNLAKIAIGAAAIAVGVIATAVTGGAAAPVLVASLKIAATSAAIGAVSGAGISAVNHRVSTGSWEGAGKATVTGAIDGACDGFMWGGITAGASFTTVAAKGIKVKEIGKLKPSNKPGDGYSGVKYQAPKANGKYTTRSIELHSPHKSGPHNVWHWQQNTWNPYNNSITGSAKHWTIWGKPL